MNFIEALRKAVNKKKCMALPWNEECHGDGSYMILLEPHDNYFDCLEFYGRKVWWNNFPIYTSIVLDTSWELIDFKEVQ